MSYEDGTYEMTVTGVAMGKTSSGRSQLAIGLTGSGGAITCYQYFGETAIPHTEKALRACGWDPVQNGWNVANLVADQSIVGAEVSAVIEMEEYNGTTSAKVRWINSTGPALKDEMTGGELSAFTSKLQKMMGVSPGAGSSYSTRPATPARQRSVTPQAPPAAPIDQGPDEDDIPF